MEKINKSKKISRNKGKSFEEKFGKEKADEIKNKIRNSLLNKSFKCDPNSEKEIQRRKKLSIAMKKYGGYRRGSGRSKHGWYKGYWCDSSYELAYVIYNLDHNINFKRNTEKFPYTFKDETHNWIPDFILSDGVYVEVKGFLREKDTYKLDQFDKPLILLIDSTIQPYLDYAINKYGKNYIELYNSEDYVKKHQVYKNRLRTPKIQKPRVKKDRGNCEICCNPIKTRAKKFCSPECYSVSCRKVVDRPTKEELLNLINSEPMVKIGLKYGVSDNAIRKWCKFYEINIPKRHSAEG